MVIVCGVFQIRIHTYKHTYTYPYAYSYPHLLYTHTNALHTHLIKSPCCSNYVVMALFSSIKFNVIITHVETVTSNPNTKGINALKCETTGGFWIHSIVTMEKKQSKCCMKIYNMIDRYMIKLNEFCWVQFHDKSIIVYRAKHVH